MAVARPRARDVANIQWWEGVRAGNASLLTFRWLPRHGTSSGFPRVATVFLSYRHENDAHRGRVRALGGRLRDAGISVVLDQFYLDANPGGPNEGWPAWSKRQAGETDKVLIIASAGWFRCYAGTEVPGSGLGAAAEARVISQRLYNEGGVNPIARIVPFDPADVQGIPLDLQGYHRFDPARDLTAMIAWITGAAPAVLAPPPVVEWPANPPIFEWEPADCEPVRDAFTRLLTAGTPHWVLLVRGVSGTGKSLLTGHLLGLALRCDWLACGRFDLKSGADLEGELARFVAYLGVDDAVKETAGQPLRARPPHAAVLRHLRAGWRLGPLGGRKCAAGRAACTVAAHSRRGPAGAQPGRGPVGGFRRADPPVAAARLGGLVLLRQTLSPGPDRAACATTPRACERQA